MYTNIQGYFKKKKAKTKSNPNTNPQLMGKKKKGIPLKKKNKWTTDTCINMDEP